MALRLAEPGPRGCCSSAPKGPLVLECMWLVPGRGSHDDVPRNGRNVIPAAGTPCKHQPNSGEHHLSWAVVAGGTAVEAASSNSDRTHSHLTGGAADDSSRLSN